MAGCVCCSHQLFKTRLMIHLRRKQQGKRIREKYLTERYEQLLQQWVKRVDKLENSAKRRAKDARTREYFEKVFPELRKQREDKERYLRLLGRQVSSDGLCLLCTCVCCGTLSCCTSRKHQSSYMYVMFLCVALQGVVGSAAGRGQERRRARADHGRSARAGGMGTEFMVECLTYYYDVACTLVT